jgi:membrane-associated phospholipid phosphatase
MTMNLPVIRLITCIGLLITCNTSGAQDSFPYSLKKRDYWIGSLSVGVFVTGELMSRQDHNLSLTQIDQLDPAQINKFDRIATRQWSPQAQRVSNVPFKILPLATLPLFVPQLKRTKLKRAVILGVMCTETFLLTSGITSMVKSGVGRTRPYLYNTSLSSAERFGFQGNGAPVASTSFFSGHASKSFAFAFLVSKMCTDLYGKKTWCKLVWGTSVSLASLSALARVKAGVHYPTDVLAGALVGGAIGYFIPVLHMSKKENLALWVVPGHLTIQYRF